ncbi:DUF5071 domain-containing protein [Leptospira noguchii]|uniref:DUF5071 domain-containing protein n=1 Tax=Leptospira noguchii TaxID=28182 RepID=A0AAE9GF53_9LEPT|nr:DUF5071 domain-containing protein [Leptospira noguchii]UOG36272.1 DUF5071 domain-containing protein [Leptospira noguchii]UOG47236.1 DUF5071 domain-containing protein [Leptospira noguchii]UOG58911.1 DUF5071 domain-containing protein [Leptospira noguchii]
MDQNKIFQHLQNLDWNLPGDIQKNAITNLLKCTDEEIELLILPLTKWHWENASIVLENIDPQRLEKHTEKILLWLQDRNWPGAERVLRILKKIDKNCMINSLLHSIDVAKKSNDTIWEESLLDFLEEIRR